MDDENIPSGSGPASGSQCVEVWVKGAPLSGSIHEDVPDPASAPVLDLLAHLSHHAGPQTGLQDQLELVSDLPPGLDLRHNPPPPPDGEDGRTLQAGAGAGGR